MENKINSFDGEYSFLSNFYECKIIYEGLEYKNSESAFQATKCADINEREMFRNLTGGKAKRLGKKVRLREDWEQVKLSIMRNIVHIKFMENPELMILLKNTGNSWLIEGNTWHDNFYGDCSCPKCENIAGQNHLGKILMELREKI